MTSSARARIAGAEERWRLIRALIRACIQSLGERKPVFTLGRINPRRSADTGRCRTVSSKANIDPNTAGTAAGGQVELRNAAPGSPAGDNWQNRWYSA